MTSLRPQILARIIYEEKNFLIFFSSRFNILLKGLRSIFHKAYIFSILKNNHNIDYNLGIVSFKSCLGSI